MPKIDFDVVRQIALTLPDVEESGGARGVSLKVAGKMLACPAIHASAEPNTLNVRVDVDQRAELIAGDPDVYYVTDHYANYPTVLVRLNRIDRRALRDLLAMAARVINTQKTPTRPRRS